MNANSGNYENTQEISCDGFVRHLRRLRRSEQTITTYKAMLEVHLGWLEKPIAHVRREDLEDFLIWLVNGRRYNGRAPSSGSRMNYVKVLKAFYRFGESAGLVTDPAKDLRYPKNIRTLKRDALTEDELRRFLGGPEVKSAALRDVLTIRLLALSGLRVSEVAALEVKDLDLKAREIRIRQGKGAKDRLAFMDRETAGMLRRFVKGREGRLFLTRRGRPIDVQEIRRQVKLRAAEFSLKLTPHSLRRTFCTLLLQAGCNLKAIAELAGHESISTTARYAQIRPEALAKVYRSAHPRSGDRHAE